MAVFRALNAGRCRPIKKEGLTAETDLGVSQEEKKAARSF
jgi:hypothetical protein